ncbi:zinc-binding dehydrogenase [Pseudooceanicola sp. CBS1P-1]|uniref:enoyl-[acyl-carrier-protein] reductase n=1 Tax=Pseudooceanicola albus TaxID=2692189 RepID=A0A6L7FZY1_9RHOB|nr:MULTISPECIES: zinc-binding dehydrogenase [Pseudooceanicola]MBT9382255.1 zinc-binding dehydrogenase [Pseudooceanicola endophyticus]MXN16798.1 zinc-binding dehydrogenase [Pseudooceanicola albus]
MKAAVHDRFGEPKEVLECRDMPLPEPGPGEVRVRTLLSPVHNHDLWTIRGSYGYKPPLPGAIGGSEAAGTVEAVGEGVDAALIGRRIAVAGVHGTWAEAFLAPAASLLPLPEGLSDEMGAQLIAMPFSAITLLDMLKAQPGDWIVQTAANGAVGQIMIGLARARGIHLLNLVRREEAAEAMRAAGVEAVLSTSDPDWIAQAEALMSGGRVVSAIDSVGGEVGAALTQLLGVNGELVVFGTATGAPMPLSSGALIMKQLTIKGFWGAQVSADMAPEKRRALIGELLELAMSGALVLETGGTFGLDQLEAAMVAALTPGRPGKVMLAP